jgi:pyruvate/2-oxoglutarate dehydrogenase complex dihydrolipoamide acyltransferase (E2) component
MPNLELVQKKNLSSFRLISIGTWKTTYDPSVYGSMKINIEEALRYRDAFREKTGRRLTLTHMMAKAVAGVLEKMPDANAIIRRNRIYLRKDIGVFFQVALEDEKGEIDLSGMTVHQADKKTMVEIFDEFKTQVEKVRSRKDEQLESTRGLFKKIPYRLLNFFLNTIGYLSYELNLDMTWAGIPKDPFGSVMVTNVGSLGLEAAYVPLVPYSRVPLLIAMGAVSREPVIDGDDIRIGQVLRLYATFDHRVLDGSHAATMSKTLRLWLEDPFNHFDKLD